VTVQYSTDQKKASQSIENPLDRPVEIQWGGAERVEAYFIDTDGTAVVNTAKQLFEQLPERESGELEAVWIENRASFNVTQAYQYQHVLNSASFTFDGVSIPALAAKMGIINAQKLTENDVTYYRVSIPMKFRDPSKPERSWQQVYESRGSEDINGQKKLVDGVEVASWPLDAGGAFLANRSDAPAQLTFATYEAKSFSVWGFS